MLNQLSLEPLETRRRIQRLGFVYKILHGQVAVPMADVNLQYSKLPGRGEDTNTRKLETLSSNTNEFKYSFASRTIIEWNSTPESITSADCSIIQESAQQAPSTVVRTTRRCDAPTRDPADY